MYRRETAHSFCCLLFHCFLSRGFFLVLDVSYGSLVSGIDLPDRICFLFFFAFFFLSLDLLVHLASLFSCGFVAVQLRAFFLLFIYCTCIRVTSLLSIFSSSYRGLPADTPEFSVVGRFSATFSSPSAGHGGRSACSFSSRSICSLHSICFALDSYRGFLSFCLRFCGQQVALEMSFFPVNRCLLSFSFLSYGLLRAGGLQASLGVVLIQGHSARPAGPRR